MKLLFLGYSRFVRKRALNAAVKLGRFSAIGIASQRATQDERQQLSSAHQVFDDYAKAIDEFKPDLVYVSLVNSAHATWAEYALMAGAHVVVDKPAFMTLQQTQQMLAIAAAQKKCLSEAMVYAYHPQIAIARQAFADSGSPITRVSAFFTFPPLLDHDYRYHSELGGGSLMDQGAYATSMFRVFMGEAPQKIFAQVNSRRGNVDISFSVLATFTGGRSLVGHFGFDTEYCNAVTLVGPGMSMNIERVCTIEPTLENTLHIKQQNQSRSVVVPRADNVMLYLEQVLNTISTGKYDALARDMLQDADAMDRLRISAEHAGNE